MSLTKIFITLGFITFTAWNFASQAVAQTQSTCSPNERKQFVLTAVAKDGHPIDKLRAEHLRLKVGGEAATISDLVFRSDDPLDLAVIIDASASMERLLDASKAAARAFVKGVTILGQDRVAVVSFATSANYLQVLTSDIPTASATIDQVTFKPPSGYIGGGVVVSKRPPTSMPITATTSLWDAVQNASQELFNAKSENRRRVILLFTDGNDTSSSGKLSLAIENAIKHEASVFAIGLSDPEFLDGADGSLAKLSEQTGGVARFPSNKKAVLEATLTEMAKHMRGSYVVGYCGGAAKDRPKLQLEVVDPEMRKTKPVLAYKRYQH